MRSGSTTCLRHWRAATLIEVLAGLAILGSVTVALLLARGNLLAQHTTAQQKLEAVRIADQLLAGWYTGAAEDSGGAAPPVDEGGQVEGYPGWSWRTSLVDATPILDDDNTIPVEILKFELFNANSSSPQTATMTLELLAPISRKSATEPGGPA